MGIVYGVKVGRGYISKPKWTKLISRRRTTKALTRQNAQFLRSLGLKVVGGK